MKSAKEILATVASVLDSRGQDRDLADERSISVINEVYHAISGKTSVETDADGWMYMMAVKLGRMRIKFKEDDLYDLIGYSSLYGEEMLYKQDLAQLGTQPEPVTGGSDVGAEPAEHFDAKAFDPEWEDVGCDCNYCVAMRDGRKPADSDVVDRNFAKRLGEILDRVGELTVGKTQTHNNNTEADRQRMIEAVKQLRMGKLSGGIFSENSKKWAFFQDTQVKTRLASGDVELAFEVASAKQAFQEQITALHPDVVEVSPNEMLFILEQELGI